MLARFTFVELEQHNLLPFLLAAGPDRHWIHRIRLDPILRGSMKGSTRVYVGVHEDRSVHTHRFVGIHESPLGAENEKLWTIS